MAARGGMLLSSQSLFDWQASLRFIGGRLCMCLQITRVAVREGRHVSAVFFS